MNGDDSVGFDFGNTEGAITLNDGGGGNAKLLKGGDFVCRGEIGREEGCEDGDAGVEGSFEDPTPEAREGVVDRGM